MTWAEYHSSFMKELNGKRNNELIEMFNNSIGIYAYGIPRSAYLSAIKKQFILRNIDFSTIGNKTTLSFARKVKLINSKLIPIEK